MAKKYIPLIQASDEDEDDSLSSEAVRQALRRWKTRHLLGERWEEGLENGSVDPEDAMEFVQPKARRRPKMR